MISRRADDWYDPSCPEVSNIATSADYSVFLSSSYRQSEAAQVAKIPCAHCGQPGESGTTCKSCGAPIFEEKPVGLLHKAVMVKESRPGFMAWLRRIRGDDRGWIWRVE